MFHPGRCGPVRGEAKKTSIRLANRIAFAGVATRKGTPIPTLESASDIRSPRIVKHERVAANRRHLDLRLEVLNLLNRRVSDIDYYYTSRLFNEPAEGVNDIHLHPALPRTARVNLIVGF